MKKASIILNAIILITLALGTSSCLVLTPKDHHDNGKHKGWYKNKSNTPIIIIKSDNHDNKSKGKSKNKGKKH